MDGDEETRVDVPLRVFSRTYYPNLVALYKLIGVEIRVSGALDRYYVIFVLIFVFLFSAAQDADYSFSCTTFAPSSESDHLIISLEETVKIIFHTCQNLCILQRARRMRSSATGALAGSPSPSSPRISFHHASPRNRLKLPMVPKRMWLETLAPVALSRQASTRRRILGLRLLRLLRSTLRPLLANPQRRAQQAPRVCAGSGGSTQTLACSPSW